MVEQSEPRLHHPPAALTELPLPGGELLLFLERWDESSAQVLPTIPTWLHLTSWRQGLEAHARRDEGSWEKLHTLPPTMPILGLMRPPGFSGFWPGPGRRQLLKGIPVAWRAATWKFNEPQLLALQMLRKSSEAQALAASNPHLFWLVAAAAHRGEGRFARWQEIVREPEDTILQELLGQPPRWGVDWLRRLTPMLCPPDGDLLVRSFMLGDEYAPLDEWPVVYLTFLHSLPQWPELLHTPLIRATAQPDPFLAAWLVQFAVRAREIRGISPAEMLRQLEPPVADWIALSMAEQSREHCASEVEKAAHDLSANPWPGNAFIRPLTSFEEVREAMYTLHWASWRWLRYHDAYPEMGAYWVDHGHGYLLMVERRANANILRVQLGGLGETPPGPDTFRVVEDWLEAFGAEVDWSFY